MPLEPDERFGAATHDGMCPAAALHLGNGEQGGGRSAAVLCDALDLSARVLIERHRSFLSMSNFGWRCTGADAELHAVRSVRIKGAGSSGMGELGRENPTGGGRRAVSVL